MNWDEEAKADGSRACSVNGCDRKHKGRGFCELHLKRFRKHGDPLLGGLPDIPAYRTVHNRLKAKRGVAASYQCVDCGRPAAQWSYDGSDPDEIRARDGRGYELAYSVDLNRYHPRCIRCHNIFDHPAKTQCPSGHDMDQENTWIDNRGGRVCRRCKAERFKKWKESQGRVT